LGPLATGLTSSRPQFRGFFFFLIFFDTSKAKLYYAKEKRTRPTPPEPGRPEKKQKKEKEPTLKI
jgi:hypothetical protein